MVLTFEQAVAALQVWNYSEREHRARCPAHGGHNRNLSVWADERGIACFKCFSKGCTTREIEAALGEAPAPPKSAPRPAKPKRVDEKGNRDRALEIWREAREARGTVVHDYLFGRGWTGETPTALCVGADPAELARAGIGLAIPTSIRFHPRLWYATGVYLPAMIAAIEGLDGCIVGVHSPASLPRFPSPWPRLLCGLDNFFPRRTRFMISLRSRLLRTFAHFVRPPLRPASLVSMGVSRIIYVGLRQTTRVRRDTSGVLANQ